MSEDISKILRDWEFDPDDVTVRLVDGDDGRQKVQIRVDLGLLQMEMHGRPDGMRPENCDSWLDYYELKVRQRQENHEEEDWKLAAEDCGRLLREGIQFYHRYVAFWHLKLYHLCARDTQRNLRLFAYVRKHARNMRDRLQFDQWRPYVTMMHTRAVAFSLVEAEEFEKALQEIDSGISGIRAFLDEYDQTDQADECSELTNLLEWREEIGAAYAKRSAGSQDAAESQGAASELRERLEAAVAEERYEEAARLRDQIRRTGN